MHSLYHNDLSDSFPNKYISDHDEGYPRPELIKEHLEAEANSINATLATLFPQRPRLGLLFSPDPYETEKTIDMYFHSNSALKCCYPRGRRISRQKIKSTEIYGGLKVRRPN